MALTFCHPHFCHHSIVMVDSLCALGVLNYLISHKIVIHIIVVIALIAVIQLIWNTE